MLYKVRVNIYFAEMTTDVPRTIFKVIGRGNGSTTLFYSNQTRADITEIDVFRSGERDWLPTLFGILFPLLLMSGILVFIKCGHVSNFFFCIEIKERQHYLQRNIFLN